MSGLKITLPAPCAFILSRLHENGFEAYAVGGCVRDSLLHKTPHDWDITTVAKPKKIIELFSDIPVLETGLKHGTVTLLINHEPYEVTTFRVDGDYTDGRHPDSVAFTADIRDDLARRDLTINAMAYSPATGIIDPFGGQEDLKNEIIRCVGDPHKRFSEDALRLMRTIRFAAVLGFTVEPETLRAVHDLHEAIGRVAQERIFTELLKTVCAPHAAEALRAAPELFFAPCRSSKISRMCRKTANITFTTYGSTRCTRSKVSARMTPSPALRFYFTMSAKKPSARRVKTVMTTFSGTRRKAPRSPMKLCARCTATTKRAKTSWSLFCCTIPLFRSARQSSAACSQSSAMSSSTACSP